MVLSPKVQRFAEAMQANLNANAHKDQRDETGQRTEDGWLKDDPHVLCNRATEELHEVWDVLYEIASERMHHRIVSEHEDESLKLPAMARKLLSECADVANFLLMTADVSGAFTDV